MNKGSLFSTRYILLFLTVALLPSCNPSQQQLTSEQITNITADVTRFTTDIQSGISTRGPKAWLNYFENSPDFFMASEGQVVFHNYDAAQVFIEDTLVKNISKIRLQWIHLRVNPLSPKAATIGSNFHEDLTIIAGQKKISVEGYFTGVAVLTNYGWKLRSLHWSVKTH